MIRSGSLLFSLDTLVGTADGGLHVITSGYRVDSSAPDIRAKLGKSEPRVDCDNAYAEARAGLALAVAAQVQIVDIDSECIRENLAVCGLGRREVSSEIHVATNQSECVVIIEQKGLYSKPFCTFIILFNAGTVES